MYWLSLAYARIDLADDPGLCGSFCVWLAKAPKEMTWLSGRFLNAKWDADELLVMNDATAQRGLLKSGIVCHINELHSGRHLQVVMGGVYTECPSYFGTLRLIL